MTAPDSVPLHAVAEDNLAAASPDLLRAMVKTFADALRSAEADALCNAEYGQLSDERVNHRNGHRPREWDTRAGTVELAIPKLRQRMIARGLSGVQLVVSDAHAGLVDEIGAVLPGSSWQRFRTHYARNLLSQVPKSAQPWVATLLRTVFEQPDADAVRAQMRHVLDALEAKFPKAAAHLDTAQHDCIFPDRTALIRLVGAVLAEQNDEKSGP